MQIEIYQWLVPLIAFFLIGRTIYQYTRQKRSTLSLIVWCIFWLVIAVLAILPNAVSFKIAALLGFKSNVNAIIFVALGMLFLFVFYLTASVERLERKMTRLVRELAIKEEELSRLRKEKAEATKPEGN